MLRGINGLNIVGGDVVEVSPPFDTRDQITALTGATVMYEILCLVAAGIQWT
jgi:guanidinopropionase